MNNGYVTTPFGRRPMTLGMLADHIASNDTSVAQSVDKWKLYRDLCQAKPLLGLSDRALALLNALLSFYPKTELCAAHGLVVFPSNHALSLRTHGMAEQTIRRHLAALVDAGLLLRKDSPNGKRYARRSRAGEVSQAFGFSLAPLLSRADEIASMADKVEMERQQIHLLREEISLHRRDIVKLLAVSEAEQIPGHWSDYRDRLAQLISAVPRNPGHAPLSAYLSQLSRLHVEIVNSLKEFAEFEKAGGNTHQNERHIESKPESRFDSNISVVELRANKPSDFKRYPEPMITTDLLTKACPNVATLTPNNQLSPSNLMTTLPLLCSMLSINWQVLDFANSHIGSLETAVTIACIYEKGEAIGCASAYLRNLASSAKNGRFSVRPMLDALLQKSSDQPEPATDTLISEPKPYSDHSRPASVPRLAASKQIDPRLHRTANTGSPAFRRFLSRTQNIRPDHDPGTGHGMYDDGSMIQIGSGGDTTTRPLGIPG